MQSSFYADVFARNHLSIVVPDPNEQSYVHEKYIGELLKGIVLPETREGLTAIISRMKARNRIEGVILGGTELSLIFREPGVEGIPVLDTTEIHVKSAVKELLRD